MQSNIISTSGAKGEVGTGGAHGTGNGIGGYGSDGEGAGAKRFYQSPNAWE